jgi:hypothetical protein
VLGRKLDSVPFGAYHILIIAVLALVGFIEGYDLVMTGSLLVLAKAPLHLTGSDIRWHADGPTLTQLSQLEARIGDFSGFGPENASLFRG